MKIPKSIKPFVWKLFKSVRTENGFKVKTFPEGFRMNLDMSEVIDNNLYYGIYEKETTRLFRQLVKPNMVVVDVGANIGYYSLLSSKLVGEKGKVLAFEPTTKAHKRLLNNYILNRDGDADNSLYNNIDIFRFALGDFEGEKRCKIRSSYKISEPFTPEKWEEYSENEVFLFKTLDSFKLKQLDFIKIDVDGSEVQVLEGAKNTIKRCKPTIIIEILAGNLDKVKRLLKDYLIVPYDYKENERMNNYVCKIKKEHRS